MLKRIPHVERLVDRLAPPDLPDTAGGLQAAEDDRRRSRLHGLLQHVPVAAVDLLGDGAGAKLLPYRLAIDDPGDRDG